MKIVLVKDSVNCTRCKAFLKAGCEPALAKLATVVVADKAAKPNSVWSKWLTKCAPFIVAAKGQPKKVNYPFILITDDAEKKVVGGFSAYDYKAMTPASVTAKVKAVCPECCDGCADAPADEPTLYKECPTCKGAGKIAVALVCLLTLWGAGCCATRIDTPEASGWRVAFLYPFEMGQAKLQTKNGSAEIGTYKTDGGATGVCQVIDSSGNAVGTFIGGAAKAAVVP